MNVIPYKEEKIEKKKQISKMFDNLSSKYDFSNHFLSFYIDKYWRKSLIKMLQHLSPKIILDVATGTGDLALEALKLKPNKIIAIDISEGMLRVGKNKVEQVSDIIQMVQADSEKLPFPSNQFDAVTIAFGVRNFENWNASLLEIKRVMKPNSCLMILEFSHPKLFLFSQLYKFYLKTLLPRIGRFISGNKVAYNYLAESVTAFPNSDDFKNILIHLGFTNVSYKRLTFGISSIYVAHK